jgi:hypothetical protein
LLPGSQDSEAPAEEAGSEEESAASEEDAADDEADTDDADAEATDAEADEAEESAPDDAGAEPAPGDERAPEEDAEPEPEEPEAEDTEAPEDTGAPDDGDTAPDDPTPDDTSDSTAAPSTGGTMVGEVISGGNIRTQPDLADEMVQGQVCPGDTLSIIEEQTIDEITWYHVRVSAAAADCVANHVAVNTEGWISSVLVSEPVPAEEGSAPAETEPAATTVPDASDAPDAPADAPELSTVTVTTGGNIRTQPLIADETVQGQVCSGDQVQILEDRLADDILWYRVRIESVVDDCVPNHVAVGTEGWVSDLLLGTP